MLTSGNLKELVRAKTIDYDKKLNFEMSVSYTPDLAILEGTGSFRLTKQIFQKSCIFNKMNMVNFLYPNPIFYNPKI
jgi:hypothetical protein